jgi:hypothetical protein
VRQVRQVLLRTSLSTTHYCVARPQHSLFYFDLHLLCLAHGLDALAGSHLSRTPFPILDLLQEIIPLTVLYFPGPILLVLSALIINKLGNIFGVSLGVPVRHATSNADSSNVNTLWFHHLFKALHLVDLSGFVEGKRGAARERAVVERCPGQEERGVDVLLFLGGEGALKGIGPRRDSEEADVGSL